MSLPDWITGANVSVQEGKISVLKSENKSLKKLKNTLTSTTSKFKYVVENSVNNTAITSAEKYRSDAQQISRNMTANYSAYNYLNVFRTKFVDHILKVMANETYLDTKFADLRAVYAKIISIQEDNDGQIAVLKSEIETIRAEATQRYWAEQERKAQEALAALTGR